MDVCIDRLEQVFDSLEERIFDEATKDACLIAAGSDILRARNRSPQARAPLES